MGQHIGDGSIYHSSYLNVRWAVAAGVNITFKLLYNGVVANTGAQDPVGSRGLQSSPEGSSPKVSPRSWIVTKEPRRYRGARLAPGVRIRPADQLVATAAELAKVPGTTVMIYDESCANERRRLQRRGKLEAPNRHVLVNTEVCENCGDCGVQRQLHVPAEGGPPSSATRPRVHPRRATRTSPVWSATVPRSSRCRPPREPAIACPRPQSWHSTNFPSPSGRSPGDPFGSTCPAWAGTGVLTLNGILSVAATLDGYRVLSYDQPGARRSGAGDLQSGAGPPGATGHAHSVGRGRADLYLALDEVGAAAAVNLDRCSPGRYPCGAEHRPVPDRRADPRRAPRDRQRRAAHRDRTHSAMTCFGYRPGGSPRSCSGDYMLTNVWQ